MDDASKLNEVLAQHAPAAARCLSAVGRRAVFPKGIPYQTAQAKNTQFNGTIGQFTVKDGAPLPVPAMSEATTSLDPKIVHLYAPQEGHAALRQAWAVRQRKLSLGSNFPVAVPMTVHGHTQGISLVADMFADEETDVIIPDPCWENYSLMFNLKPGARIVTYPFFRQGRFNVEGLSDVLAATSRKAVILVNFPANPAGYTPTPAEVEQLVQALLNHRGPAVVLFDDAYQGMVFESGLMARSPFWDLVERADPDRLFVMKTDGATKELFFFGGRVGFLTHGATGPAEDAILSKLKCIARSTVGVGSGPSQALVLKALQDPGLDASIAERLGILGRRYRALKSALGNMNSSVLSPFPFNSGVFALVGVRPDVDAEELRQRLITEASVGTISIPSVNALRVAYCSVEEDAIPELVARMAKVAG